MTDQPKNNDDSLDSTERNQMDLGDQPNKIEKELLESVEGYRDELREDQNSAQLEQLKKALPEDVWPSDFYFHDEWDSWAYRSCDCNVPILEHIVLDTVNANAERWLRDAKKVMPAASWTPVYFERGNPDKVFYSLIDAIKWQVEIKSKETK